MRRPIQEAPFVKRRREQLDAPKPQEEIEKGRIHRAVDWIDNWHVTRLFQAMGSFLLILTIVGFCFEYEDRKQNRIVNAWQLITTKAPGRSGKAQALEYLNSVGMKLSGVDLSTNKDMETPVYLSEINLPSAQLYKARLMNVYLYGANLRSGRLEGANLTNAVLWNANLEDADLKGANLEDANLEDANLEDADLRFTNLANAKNLTCKQLTQAFYWRLSYRDKELACGADIPIKPEK